MPLSSGATVGPYVIRSMLGAGGMGEVYRAHDTNLARDVALKLLPADLARDPDRLRRFEQEARSASALNHPAIVAIQSTLQSFPQSWSADGRFLAYVTVDPKTRGDIWVVPLDGDRKPKPVLQSPFDESYARISPDGRWLAYSSNESGQRGVYVTRFPEGGGKWLVSTSGGDFPVWSRDGRELFYRAPDRKFMAVPIAPGANFAPGSPVPLFEAPAAVSPLGIGTFYDVAPDGRFLINLFVERRSPPATVVLNWRASIPRN